jgi:hypothetical protein
LEDILLSFRCSQLQTVEFVLQHWKPKAAIVTIRKRVL